MKLHLLVGIVLLCLFNFLTCLSDSNLAGGGTETTNGKIDVKVLSDSLLIQCDTGIEIMVCDTAIKFLEDHQKVYSAYSTSSNTPVRIEIKNEGVYSIIFRNHSELLGARSQLFKIPSDSNHSFKLTLEKLSSITGRVNDATINTDDRYYVALKGTPFMARCDTMGNFIIPKIPASSYKLFTYVFFKYGDLIIGMTRNINLKADTDTILPSINFHDLSN